MKVTEGFDRVDKREWTSFLESCSDSNIFQTPGMYGLFQSDHKYEPGIAICSQNGKILGILEWAIRREYSGLIGSMTARSVVFGGPLVPDKNPEVARLLLQKYLSCVKKKAIYSEFRNLSDLSWAWPEFCKIGFSREPHMNYLIDISKSENDLLAAMSQSRRKMLRRVSKKNDLRVECVTDKKGLTDFFRLVELTYKKVKKPYPDYMHFEKALELLGDGAACFLCLKGDIPIASRFVFCYNEQVYDWYAGSDTDYHNDNPNEFIVWEILKWAKGKGYLRFDFGGGGNPKKPYGPREFKRRFGGEEVYFDRYTIIHKPLLMGIAKAGFFIKQKTHLF